MQYKKNIIYLNNAFKQAHIHRQITGYIYVPLGQPCKAAAVTDIHAHKQINRLREREKTGCITSTTRRCRLGVVVVVNAIVKRFFQLLSQSDKHAIRERREQRLGERCQALWAPAALRTKIEQIRSQKKRHTR